MRLYDSLLDCGAQVEHALGPDRKAWIQIARGTIEVDGHRLEAGDGFAVQGVRPDRDSPTALLAAR